MMRIIHRLFHLCDHGRTAKPPEDFQTDNPPGWIVDLKGQALPHGRRHSLRVLLDKSLRSGRVEIQYLPRRYDQAHQERKLTRELTAGQSTCLLDMLSSFFPAQITNVKSAVRDGFPSTLTIYRRKPYVAVTAKCNMAEWFHSSVEPPPVAKICAWLLDIERMELGDDWWS